MSQWMRQKEAQQRCVTVTHHGQSAHSDNQAAEFIHEFWSQLWTEQAQRTERLGVNAESIARTLTHPFSTSTFCSPVGTSHLLGSDCRCPKMSRGSWM